MVYDVQEGTSKGSKLYVSGDYAYVKDKLNVLKLYLKCRHYKTCRGRAYIIDDGYLRHTGQHSCNSRSLDTAVIAFKNILKSQAEESTESLKKLYESQIANSQEIAEIVPFNDVASAMAKRRQRTFIPVKDEEVFVTEHDST
jgi:hypothetical protein